jgi:hypothetical protein
MDLALGTRVCGEPLLKLETMTFPDLNYVDYLCLGSDHRYVSCLI